MSPGLEAVTTDSGTLESEQPIHNTYQKPITSRYVKESEEERGNR